MPIRKTGSATGQVTGIEQPWETNQAEHDAATPPSLRQAVASAQEGYRQSHGWSGEDERELAAENDRDEPAV
jgi:hypothetical protein